MTLHDRLRQLASALPSDDSAVTLTRADLVALLEDEVDSESVRALGDLTVDEVAEEVGRAPSTVRTWLIAGGLKGYKLRRRDWRVTRAALRAFLDSEAKPPVPPESGKVDIGAWRKLRGAS